MSAQAGIFYFDGRPIEPGLPTQLDAELAEFGPDGSGQYVAPGLLMAHRALHVTPEDCLERQPYVSERGNVMTWDGRLDNREDLLLQLWRDLKDDTTDVALAMAAYEKWGEDGLARLVGDWSLALWDAAPRELLLASDYMGIRPLYYAHDRDEVAWSSDLGLLVSRLSAVEIDDRFIVGYLTFAIPPETTPYRRIKSVPSGHLIRAARPGPAQRSPFWQLKLHDIHYKNSLLYQEHLRSVFREGVAARLRSQREVLAELSGGLDSTSVVCLADQLIRRREALAPALHTVSFVTKRSAESDESRFISVVEGYLGRSGTRIDGDESVDPEIGGALEVTPQAPAGMHLAVHRLAQARGARVLLTGRLGDAVMGNFPAYRDPLSDFLRHRAVIRFLTSARKWSLATRRPIWQVIAASLRSMLPPMLWVEREIANLITRYGGPDAESVPDPAAVFSLRAERLELWHDEVVRHFTDAARWRSSKRQLLHSITYFATQRSCQSHANGYKLVTTHPYAHRPLVEFVAAIPLDVLCPPGRPRALMRDAFEGFVPPRILGRTSKGYAAPFLARRARAYAGDLLSRVDDLHLVKGGYVDRERLRKRLQAAQTGATSMGNLPAIYQLESWLQRRGELATR